MARSESEILTDIEKYTAARDKALLGSYTVGGEFSVQRPELVFLEERLKALRVELDTVRGTSRGVRSFGVVL